ncbi:MAG: NAD(+) diphosphatase [Clostridium sp.]|nr:NAD(+) diphosphatase [Clostridium sp.]
MYWFVFRKNELLVEHSAHGEYTVPADDRFQPSDMNCLQLCDMVALQGEVCRAVRVSEDSVANGRGEWVDLRQSFDLLPSQLYQMAGRASELLYWDKRTRYCGICGAPTEVHTDISRRCTSCGELYWPQLATAIIVLVRREDRILMVRAHNFRGDFYGLVAGFVETGETLEECVAREVWEETHIRVKNIRYVASQPWPYPCGLMVGFCADYESGEIRLQTEELAAGQWFDRFSLPQLPGRVSLARRIIDGWLTGNLFS